MTPRILAVFAVVLVAGCSSPPAPRCDSSLCSGCCDSAGQCQGGNTLAACGAQGLACDVCVSPQLCSAGKCGGSGVGGGTAVGGGSGGGGSGGGGGGGVGGGTGGGTTVPNTGTFPDLTDGDNGRHPQLMIDATGKRHIFYEQLLGKETNGTIPFRYGECSSDCSVASSWQFASVGNRDTLGSLGKMALNAQGKPRVMWVKGDTSSAPYSMHFGSCDSNCTTATNWTTGNILTLSNSVYSRTGRNLSVDGTGRVHFVYAQSGLFYITCPGNCTVASSWTAPLQLLNDAAKVSLATTATGQVRLAYTSQFGQVLTYRTCEGGCDVLANWSAEALLRFSYEGPVSLRLDAQGRPRIFYNEAGTGASPTRNTLYGWCDSSCGVVANWSFVTIGLLEGDGEFGLDFDLHAGGAVSVALQTPSNELAVVRCLSSCQSLSGTWTLTVVETTDSIKAEVSPPLPNCSNFNPPKTPYAYWAPGEQASAAVNPLTDKIEVVHRTYTNAKCGFSGNVFEGVTLPRFSGPF